MSWKSLINNPWVGAIGTLLGAIGLILAVVLYLKSKRFQRPTYYKQTVGSFDGATVPHNDIKLTFRGKEIPRFKITKMAFWNSGNQAIRRSDFASTSTLRLAIPPNTEVFDIRILSSTTPETDVSLDAPSSFVAGIYQEIPINFEYFDPEDGFSLQIIHDSQSDDQLKFLGKLPGVSNFAMGNNFRTPPLMKWFIFPQTMLFLGGLGVWSIYHLMTGMTHWYQIPGAILVIYLFAPLLLFTNKEAPSRLENAGNTVSMTKKLRRMKRQLTDYTENSRDDPDEF